MVGMSDKEQIATLSQEVKLPCGRVLPNRLVKAAMEEMLSPGTGLPSDLDEALYEVWAEGGWGMVIAGNVQVSARHLGTPLDIVVPPSPVSPAALAAFSSWARSARPATSSSQPSPLILLQLNHPGRQSARILCGRGPYSPALAPSAVPLQTGTGPLARATSALAWGTPREMSLREIDDVVEQFVAGARLAHETGWDGVELHASHGYLLAQFMSPKVNRRTDDYGGSARKRLTLLFRIIDAIRLELPQEKGFCLGVKLNSSDYVEQDALDNVKWIAEHGGIDFIEISGGSYEHPALREAFFDAFSSRARWLVSTLPPSTLPSPAPLILLTGGFRSRTGICRALSTSTKSPPAADLAGLARPAAADPFLPLTLLAPTVPSALAHAPVYDALSGVRWLRWLLGWLTVVGPGLDVLYHTLLLRQIALQRVRDKRRFVALHGADAASERAPVAVVRSGAGQAAFPLSNFWVLGWRVWVAPVVPGWVVGMAGALLFAVAGKRWKTE
ncbi:hypothetical protein Rhopal_002140-T1 [Rhodotorula paludigena]|uniref:NADH:flavin oxidoreductase/NADH oxidase N-terminal domain-containing protein n=1 Tax=Rhodotorula paludigena TaxID=86838 RepID=A0AAV5G9V7_9BASI|nr:hypothetical protein Rhopal_002140-T1 [Rhodotorula paludigena]